MLGAVHVEDVQLVAFAEGGLAAAERERIAAHLDTCDTCRELAAAASRTAVAPRTVGSELGRYRLGRLLGAGQMGEVYAAYDPALGREVALKLIHPRGDDPRAAAERLLVEARAMAQLRHPNAVRIYDVGTDGDEVFLTMERVGSGRTLRQWLADEARAPAAILAAFRAIAEALHAAHAAGVIHGDVKPDNVLVDDDGRVLVADFGLARAGGRLASTTAAADAAIAATLPAIVGPVGGTPVYMAPELFGGAMPTARSDQFSFCVALEEALTGSRPFEGDGLTSLARAIVRGERRPRRIVRGVPRRVWAAIDRGLQTEPAQRHGSLAVLAAELAPRGRVWLVAALPVVALVAAGILFALRPSTRQLSCDDAAAGLARVWTPGRATGLPPVHVRELERYAAAWSVARIETCRATRDGTQSQALLDARMGCLDEQLEQLASAVELARSGGDARAGEAVRRTIASLASPAHCREIGAARARLVAPPPEIAGDVASLRRELARATTADEAGDRERARRTAETVVTRARALGYAPLLAEALVRHGKSLHEDAKAEQLFREAAQVAASAHYDRLEADAWAQLVYLAGYIGSRHAEADAWASAARAAIARAGNPPSLEATLVGHEAALALSLGDAKTALARADRWVELERANDRPADLAVALSARAAALKRLGKRQAARDVYREAIALLAREPEAHGVLSSVLASDLAVVLARLGELAEAERLLTGALATQQALLAPGDIAIGSTLDHLGALARRKGDLAAAEQYFQRAHDEVASTNPRRAADALANLAVVLTDRGKLALARASLDEVVRVRERLLPATHPDLAEAHLNLALIDMRQGKPKLAAQGFERARDAFAAALGDGAHEVAVAWVNLGDARAADGDVSAAALAYREGVKRLEQRPGTESELAYALVGLASVLLETDPAAAVGHAERAVAASKGAALADARFVLAQALWAVGKDRARALVEAHSAAALLGNGPAAAPITRWIAAHER